MEGCLATRVAVVGAGLMGHGIAQVFAVHGHAVRITDPFEGALASVSDRVRTNLAELGGDLAAAERIEGCPSLEDAVAGADYGGAEPCLGARQGGHEGPFPGGGRAG